MSNLSELLPSGGGQNVVEFTADGAISSGAAVALQTDGTVTPVTETNVAQSIETATSFNSSSAGFLSGIYEPVNNKLVIAYADGSNSNYATAVVGTVSDGSISFGTPTVFNSGYGYIYGINSDTAGKVFISFRDTLNNNWGTGIVGTISGTSISFGSKSTFNTTNTLTLGTVAQYPTGGKLVLFYQYSGSTSLRGVVVTISGTSFSLGSDVQLSNGGNSGLSAAYDSANDKIVLAFTTSTSTGAAKVVSISGTSISSGVEVVFDSTTGIGYIACAYHTAEQKTAIAYTDGSGGNGTVVLGTVSGTSISFGTASTYNTGDTYGSSVNYHTASERLVFFFRDNANFGRIKVMSATVSGNTFTFTAELTVLTSGHGTVTSGYGIAYDPDTEQSVLVYSDSGNSYRGTVNIYNVPSTTTNVSDFIGLAADAISDTASGDINVKGGINEAQTGLTIGSDYYVQDDGTLSTTSSSVKVGQAITATTINMMDLT